MKKFLLILLISIQTSICVAKDVNTLGNKTLDLMEEMSEAWKLVKNKQSAKTQGVKIREIANKLSQVALDLTKLQRPDNPTRIKIKENRAERIKQVSLEMAKTIVQMQVNVPVMKSFEAELETIKKQMAISKKVFDLYFEPDQEKAP